MDNVFVKGLKVAGRHGVEETERSSEQQFVIDLEVAVERASLKDELVETIDYEWLVKEATKVTQTESFRLVETLAEHIADVILGDPGAKEVLVRISKPNAKIDAGFDSVGVEIRRSR